MNSPARRIVIVSRDHALCEQLVKALHAHRKADSTVVQDLSHVVGHLEDSLSQKALVVDVDCFGPTVFEQLSFITKKYPTITLVLVSVGLDITLVARSILCRATDFIVRSAHPHDAVSLVISACLGHAPKPDGVFQRIHATIPWPGNSPRKWVTVLGEEMGEHEAVTVCDRLGLSVQEIADHLQMPLRSVEEVHEAKVAPEPAELEGSWVLPRKMFLPLLAVIALLAVVFVAGLAMNSLPRSSKRKPIHGLISGGSRAPKHVLLRPSADDGRPTCSVDVIEGTFTFTDTNGPYAGPYTATITFTEQRELGFTAPHQDTADEIQQTADDQSEQQSTSATINPHANPYTLNVEIPEDHPYVIEICLP